MNFELVDKLYELLESNKLEEAIFMAEQELKIIPNTDFHKILNKNLLHLTFDLSKHINEFDKSTKHILKKKQGFIKNLFNSGKEILPAAYYCEMNGFTINNDLWFIEIFSFEHYNLSDWEWLSDFYDYTEKDFTITGFEDIQKAFKDVHDNERFEEPNILNAYQVCELIVILRLQELFREVYKDSKEDWNYIPMFVSAHDYDLIYRAN